MSTETLFPAASLGKPLAAFLALRLAQTGLIDPDRPLVHYLKLDHVPEYAGAADCTLHQVLSHCSGLPNWRRPGEALTADARYIGGFRYSGGASTWRWGCTANTTVRIPSAAGARPTTGTACWAST